jgi:Ner family transcriptional regulator
MTNPHGLKKPAPEDWHPAQVVAGLRMRGWSLAQLADANGYTHRSTLTQALRKPYPRAEKIIAGALDLKPEQIWPSRYNKDGTSNRTSGAKPMRPAHLPGKGSTHAPARNPQLRKAS